MYQPVDDVTSDEHSEVQHVPFSRSMFPSDGQEPLLLKRVNVGASAVDDSVRALEELEFASEAEQQAVYQIIDEVLTFDEAALKSITNKLKKEVEYLEFAKQDNLDDEARKEIDAALTHMHESLKSKLKAAQDEIDAMSPEYKEPVSTDTTPERKGTATPVTRPSTFTMSGRHTSTPTLSLLSQPDFFSSETEPQGGHDLWSAIERMSPR